ncbi:MAG: FAD binding domain-containing protein, partial [Candidatus Aminicenantes bacterium]|nr:FAD binding domain-containing protein [Candidatus Aminicenantes bacterium]
MVTFYRRLPEFNYLRPESLKEALSLLQKYKGKAKVIAGGTDIIPKLKRREIKPPQYLVDIKNIRKLDYIKSGRDGLKIGALTTINTVESSPIIQQEYNLLY